MRPTFFSGTLSKVLEISTAQIEITPHSIVLSNRSGRPYSTPVCHEFEGVISPALGSFIRNADLQGYVIDLVLCGPQVRVEFAMPVQPGADTIAWAEGLVANWLPKAMEADTVWSLDSLALGEAIPPFCMFSLFHKGYMQEIADALAASKCILRSVHGGAYPLLGHIRMEHESYAILHLQPEYSRVLIVEQGLPAIYREIPSAGLDADQRIREIERLTSFYCQVHLSKQKIGRFIVTGAAGELLASPLAAKGYTLLPGISAMRTENFSENLPPEIGAGHGRSYAKILRSREQLGSYLKKMAITAASCAALLGLFEAGVRMEKVLRAERYSAGEAILAGYSASRASLEALQLRYGDFFSAIAKRDDIPLYLDAVMQALPERVWLSEISYKTDRGERSLEFVGYTDDPTQIAPFLGRLQSNKAISGVEQRFIEVIGKDKVAQMTRHVQGAKELTKFKAEAMLK